MNIPTHLRHATSAVALIAAFGIGSAVPAQESPAPYKTPAGFEDMVADKLPSVVGVLSNLPAQNARRNMPTMPPGMEEFFGQQPQNQRPRRAQGSGFVVSDDGLIVTNNHVVQGAETVEVQLDDGSTHEVEIVGTDPATDIALLRMDADEAPEPVDWGSSAETDIGEWVVAIGNPFGLDGTVTAGILSARARDINSGPYDNFLQTDAAVNSGNSGGPLFNTSGEVIGVNTAIFSPSGGSVGIGFAVPSVVARDIVADLQDDGLVQRGYIGVRIQPVDADLGEALGLTEDVNGALIADITSGGPADEAGLQAGDVITAVDGEAIDDPRALTFAVARADAGTEVPLTVIRDGETQEISIKIGQQPDDLFASATPPMESESDPSEPRLGLSVAPLQGEARRRAGVPEDVNGLLVAEVSPGSPAAEAGIAQGDVIAEVGGAPIEGVEALREATVEAAEADRPLLVRVWRNGSYSFVPVALDDSETQEG
ncbi:MAG: Do family serine endopeptidase [Rhodobacteraceae bacterium]|uniref:Do family serine endopeptidase n=1 Tax=Marivita sp. TaxID=2003365 RepID=UPI003B524079|nr:Do family serine endopeptidase [Paracoccaceae bacterium]